MVKQETYFTNFNISTSASKIHCHGKTRTFIRYFYVFNLSCIQNHLTGDWTSEHFRALFIYIEYRGDLKLTLSTYKFTSLAGYYCMCCLIGCTFSFGLPYKMDSQAKFCLNDGPLDFIMW